MSQPAVDPGSQLNPIQKKGVDAGLDLAALPKHVAIIMDGNGRFASKQGLARLWGHAQGYKSLREALLTCSDLGIDCLTVYAFSAENWKRPEGEVSGLMELIEKSTRDEVRTMMANRVQMRVSGRLQELPPSLRDAFETAVETTKGNTGIKFCLAVNYGGRAEVVDAVRSLLASGVAPGEVTEETVAAHLYQPDMPEPDLIIRTAGEMRWSNFLIYQAAYAELVVTETTWPEFRAKDLFACLKEYQTRIRKFGGL